MTNGKIPTKYPFVLICYSISGDVFLHRFKDSIREDLIPEEHRRLQKVGFDLRDQAKLRIITHE
jgi:hypothetical protein